MNLSDVLRSVQFKSTDSLHRTSNVGESGNTLVDRQIRALTPGQTISGEIVSKDGNHVQVHVEDDFVLDAKVDSNVNLEVGKHVTFEVKNNGSTLQLSPLFANTATEETAVKALLMAALPVNEDSLKMTGLMMQGGLSVDRNALQQMFRQINTYPEADISDVVDLHRFGIAVNEENLEQVASYKNCTHQLIEGLHTIQEGLKDVLMDMVNSGDVNGAAKLSMEVLARFEDLPMTGETVSLKMQNSLEGWMALNDIPDRLLNALREELSAMPESMQVSEQELAQALTQEEAQALSREVPQGQEHWNVLPREGIGAEGSMESIAAGNAESSQTAVDTRFVGAVLQKLLAQGIRDGDTALLKELTESKAVHNIMNRGLSELMTIQPKSVAEKENVEALYNRLNKQLYSLKAILSEAGQDKSFAFQAVDNMSKNLDFLEQMNQAYTYLQLPLKFQNGEAHGDLYVYTNKRNLAARDGQISALLHLDMEHLGPVDAYVAMEGEKVNTRFYVQDDEILDFLEQHMDLLTKRLKERGYSCEAFLQTRGEDEKQSAGIHGLLEQGGSKSIAHYAFDVRA